jgi:hypothetical protein
LSSTCSTVGAIQLPGKPAFGLSRLQQHLLVRGGSVDVADDELNPPVWPKSVILINDTMSKEAILEATLHTQDNIEKNAVNVKNSSSGEIIYGSERHFVEERYAILFAPGTYENLDLEIGYYTQVAGLGARADDVKFINCDHGPFCPALKKDTRVPVGDNGNAGLSLDTFWRVAENYYTEAKKGQLWAVSQAAPIRRVSVKGDLLLHDDGAFASGGHMANCEVGGNLVFGSQQQFCCRSVNISTHDLGAWSNVFVDCIGGPDKSTIEFVKAEWGDRKVLVTVDKFPKFTVEKPFVILGKDTRYYLHVPEPRFAGATPNGPDLTGEHDVVRDFNRVRVAVANAANGEPDKNVAKKINEALQQGKDIVLSPGIYYLSEPLEITKSDQVILGLGLATLVAPTDGRPCIKVPPGLDGVRVAGIMLEASVIRKASEDMVACFIEWGEESSNYAGNPKNPGALTDIFARVGGSNLDRTVSTNVMVRIHSGNVYGDNLWLWRADHVALGTDEVPNFPPLGYHQVLLGEVPCETGLEVTGDDVTIHGLAVEHTTQDQVIWKGERGNVQFYQCELSYDVDPTFADNGWLGYSVTQDVKVHTAGGTGIYSNFRDHVVTALTAIRHPESKGILFTNKFTILLGGKGSIQSIINDLGAPPLKNNGPSFLP